MEHQDFDVWNNEIGILLYQSEAEKYIKLLNLFSNKIIIIYILSKHDNNYYNIISYYFLWFILWSATSAWAGGGGENKSVNQSEKFHGIGLVYLLCSCWFTVCGQTRKPTRSKKVNQFGIFKFTNKGPQGLQKSENHVHPCQY